MQLAKDPMEETQHRFSVMLQQKRLQSLRSVDDAVEKVNIFSVLGCALFSALPVMPPCHRWEIVDREKETLCHFWVFSKQVAVLCDTLRATGIQIFFFFNERGARSDPLFWAGRRDKSYQERALLSCSLIEDFQLSSSVRSKVIALRLETNQFVCQRR